MWLQQITLPRALLLLCTALGVFRYRRRLLRLCRSLVRWNWTSSGPDPPSGDPPSGDPPSRDSPSRDHPSGEQLLCRFVMNNSVHGQSKSILESFDQWLQEPGHGQEGARVRRNHLGPEKGVFLDNVFARVAPSVVLELGTYCGYSAVRMLRLLPPEGKLYTVEKSEEVANMAEEMILVAGFKNVQFQLLVLSSEDAIAKSKRSWGVESFDLVLMDHHPGQYLEDLRALENHRLLSAGTIILANDAEGPDASDFLQDVQSDPHYWVRSRCQGLLEIVCTKERISSPAQTLKED
ncbi:catechol O-methyltransferase-like [Ambystoma mexicanum]|uniref:catechol O-methyltransferase-like n=1 Tax=Ambystoma mexicanum TaxID=8296 RepID=UPI0037E8E0C5